MTGIPNYILPAVIDAVAELLPILLGGTLLMAVGALMIFKIAIMRRRGARAFGRRRAMHALRAAAAMHAGPAKRERYPMPQSRRTELSIPRPRVSRGMHRRWRRGTFIVTGSLVISSGLARETVPPAEPSVSQNNEALATLHPGISSRTLRVSSDGQRVAYMATLQDGGQAVFVNDQQSPKYIGIVNDSLSFSPDSKRVAWAALRGEEKVVVVDGKEFPAHEGSAEGMPVWSPDGKRFAYFAAKEGGKLLAVVDGKEGRIWDSVIQQSFVFSPDSSRYAFVAKDGDSGRIVVDGEPGTAFRNVAGFTFSPDGKRFAYVGISEQSMSVIVDGVEMATARAFIKDSMRFDGPDRVHALKLEGNELVRVQIDLVSQTKTETLESKL